MPKKKSKKKVLTKHEELQLLADQVNDALGEEGKVYLGSSDEVIERVPTGVLAFDTITGGGLPRRRLTEIFGPESAGKTLLVLHIVAAVQRSGGTVAWIIGEEWDDEWAAKNGVDTDALVKIEALTGDKMLETGVTFMESGLIDLVVIDSWQALSTRREIEDGVEKESYAGAGAPQMWARFWRQCVSLFNSRQANTAILGVSQVRSAIGKRSMPGMPPPDPEAIGIWVLKHWKSISIMCKRGEPFYDDPKSEKKKLVSREFKLKCVKNKTAPPDRVSSYIYRFRGEHKGIDQLEEIIRLGKVYDVLEQRGKYLEGFGLRVAGADGVSAVDAFKDKLRSRPKLTRKIQRAIIKAANA